jgi:GTPase SAR1 family protein
MAFNSTLKKLKIDNQFIPDEFKWKPLDFIRKYFSDKSEGISNMKELKLQVVGYGGRGKTTLFRSLQGLPFSETESTDGVDIHSWKLKDMSVRVWDFAGQQVFLSLLLIEYRLIM